MRALFLAGVILSGCWWVDPNTPARPTVSELLEKCRNEARAAYYDAGATPDQAQAVYERCLVREGIQ